jgi:nitronate monooxygenase/enoyl-[acyl-carrier protein] reductase II
MFVAAEGDKEPAMLKTTLCDLLGIEHPIILAPMGSATSAAFAAAVSNAGGLGSIATLGRSTAAIMQDLNSIRNLTSRPFAVNHVPQTLDEEAFAATLDLHPAVISFALGDPGDLVNRAHDVGAKVMLQVTTVAQAILAAERGVDVVVAQGGEAGGCGGEIGTFPLVPQVVDAVAPVPVVAAGGIFDGRGLAAALLLGAVGVNLGTRFLASQEAPIEEGWRQAILAARSEDTVKAAALNAISPLPGTAGFGTVLRSIRTPFLDEWNPKLDEARDRHDQLLAEMAAAVQAGRRHEFLATAGQSAGGIDDALPVAAIIARLISEAEAAFASTSNMIV